MSSSEMTRGGLAAYPVAYVSTTPDAVLGERGVQQFADILMDVVMACESEDAVCDSKGRTKGKITMSFDIERDRDGFLRVHWALKRALPALNTHLSTLRLVGGELMVEAEVEDTRQTSLPGLSERELELQAERKAAAARAAELVAQAVAEKDAEMAELHARLQAAERRAAAAGERHDDDDDDAIPFPTTARA